MAKDPANNVLQDSTFTGFSEDNSTVRVYNPITGQYEVRAVDNWKEYNPAGDNTNWMYTPEGTRVLGLTPEGYEEYGNYNNEPGFDHAWQAGYVPPDSSGGGDPYLTLGPGDRESNGGTATQPPNNQPLDPIVNEPTNDWPEYDSIGYENVPAPDGDGEFDKWHGKNKQRDTSWNWDFFRDKAGGDRQWGGYDTDYQAFERYQPGMDSPWGMPNIEGGNEDFYQQQFVNQLRDEQSFRSRQRESQKTKAQALRNPYEAPSSEEMWSWAYGGEGLPEVQMGTGQNQPASYSFNEQFSGQNAQDIFNQLGDRSVFNSSNSSKTGRELLNNFFSNSNRAAMANEVDWSSFNNPGEAMAAVGDTNWFQGMNRPNAAEDAFGALINQMYSAGRLGPTAPVGYASPIQWGSQYETYAAGGES